MRRLRSCALAVAALIPSLPSFGVAPYATGLRETHLWTPMRDGIRLAANLFQPPAGGRRQAILIRTPYGKGTEILPNYRAFVDHGYNVMIQDVRGRYESEGAFHPLTQEPDDGEDTLNWIATQPWSDGKIGMSGGSYLGIVQWKVAPLNNPHLLAIFPAVSGDDDYRDRVYSPGGAMKWGHRLEWVSENMRDPEYTAPPFQSYIWTRPERTVDHVVTGRSTRMLQEAFDHPAYDAFWQSISVREKLASVRVPVFSVGGWYDNYVEGDLDAFATLSKHNANARILIGPWPHNIMAPLETVNFGPDAHPPIRRWQMQWFDEWLKDKPVPLSSEPPLHLFIMGANVWRDENEWPLARAVATRFYLESRGHANTAAGDGELLEERSSGEQEEFAPTDTFLYDPRSPVPTMGGAICCNNKVFPWGPMDQRPVEKRPDVLVYSTPALARDVEVTGPITLVLHAGTTARDTDFTAKLVDVYPDGQAINLTDGIIRARYRHGLSEPKLLNSDAQHKYVVDVGVTANVFRRGHRIRLEVSSSNFPRFDRNPNTGGAIADETKLVTATQTIYHDARHASYLILPVIPAKPAAVLAHVTRK